MTEQSSEAAYPAVACRHCGDEIIQPDVTMNGPRGAWVHEVSRTRRCPDAEGQYAEPTDG